MSYAGLFVWCYDGCRCCPEGQGGAAQSDAGRFPKPHHVAVWHSLAALNVTSAHFLPYGFVQDSAAPTDVLQLRTATHNWSFHCSFHGTRAEVGAPPPPPARRRLEAGV